MSCVPVPAPVTMGTFDALLDEPVTGLAERRQIAVGGRAAVAKILDMLDVPCITLNPAEAQAVACVRGLRHGHRRLRIAGAGAMQPHIHIDHQVQHKAGRRGGGLQRAQVVHVVRRHHEGFVVPAERHETVDLGGRHDGRGDEQPLDPSGRQRLRLAQGGAADAERA